MNKKITQFALTALVISFVIPNLAMASWWNPFTWFNRTVKTEVILVATSTVPTVMVSSTTATSTDVVKEKIKRVTPVTNSLKEDNSQKVAEAFKLIAEQNALIRKQKEELSISNAVKTEDKGLCIKINSMIEDGIIPSNKINSARAAAGCKTLINVTDVDEEETRETPIIRPRTIYISGLTNNIIDTANEEEDTPDTAITNNDEVSDQIDQDEDNNNTTPIVTVESRYSDYNFDYDWNDNILSCPVTSRSIVIKKAVFRVSGSELEKIDTLKGLESDGFKVQLPYPRLVYSPAANSRNNTVYGLEKRDQNTYVFLGGSIPVCTNGDRVLSSYQGVLSDVTNGGRNISAYLDQKGISIETSNGSGGDPSITPGSSNATFMVEMTPVMSDWEVFDNTQKKPVEIQ